MSQIILAAVRPAAFDGAVQAALIPTEPQAIAVYALLAWAFVMVWAGNRGSGGDARTVDTPDGDAAEAREDEVSSTEPVSEEAAGDARRRRGRRKTLSRSQRRKRGHIDWIQ